MAEHLQNVDIKPGSERSFGVVFAAVFAIIALYPLLNGGGVRWLFAAGSAAFAVTAFVWPNILAVPNRLWFRLGMLLGAVVSPIVMGLVYVAVVVPTGLVIRLMKKDPLSLSIDRHAPSYWIDRKSPMQPMKNQF